MLIRLLATSVFSSLPALALLQAMVSLGKRGACSLPAASTTQYAADRSLWLRTGPCLQGGGRKKRDSFLYGVTSTDFQPWLIVEEMQENKVIDIQTVDS